MTEDPPKPTDQHPEMAVAAQEGADSLPTDLGIPQSALTEVYRDQLELNLAAHRKMRLIAFNVVGVLSALYLLCLLCVLWRFFDGELLASVIGAQRGTLNWHLLVLTGIALVIFAAIPLSLVMALVKMISDKDEDASNIKTPTVELGKVLYDLIKGFVAGSGK